MEFRVLGPLEVVEGDRHCQGVALHSLGVVYDQQGRTDAAIDCFEQDLAICRELGDRHGEAETLKDLGQLLWRVNHHDDARSCWQRALKLFAELDEHEALEVRALLQQ